MYCTIETTFQCDGDAAIGALKFNALLEDLKKVLESHPGVSCSAFDGGHRPISADELQDHAESEAELDAEDQEEGTEA